MVILATQKDLDEALLHWGVKGMKWGVRRDAANRKGMRLTDRSQLKKMRTAKERNDYLDTKDKKWLEKVKNDSNAQKVARRTAREMKRVNKELKEQYGGDLKRAFDRKAQAKFQRDLKDAYDDILTGHTYKVYKLSPSRTREVEIKALSDGTMKAVVVERDTPKLAKQRAAITKAVNRNIKKDAKRELKDSLSHADQLDETSVLDGMFFIITMDEDGFPDDVVPPFEDVMEQAENLDDILLHWGVKGMKWDKKKTKEEQAQIDALKKQYGLSEKDAAELAKVIKSKKLTPQQTKDVVALTKTIRGAKNKKGKSEDLAKTFKKNATTATKEFKKEFKNVKNELKKEVKKENRKVNRENLVRKAKGEPTKFNPVDKKHWRKLAEDLNLRDTKKEKVQKAVKSKTDAAKKTSKKLKKKIKSLFK